MGLVIRFTMPASDTVGILLNVWLQFVMLLLSMAVALFFEVVPAAILGALYAWIKLKRGALSYLLVFICGGSTAMLGQSMFLGWVEMIYQLDFNTLIH